MRRLLAATWRNGAAMSRFARAASTDAGSVASFRSIEPLGSAMSPRAGSSGVRHALRCSSLKLETAATTQKAGIIAPRSSWFFALEPLPLQPAPALARPTIDIVLPDAAAAMREDEGMLPREELSMDSVMKKRRKKMNKHKRRKRRKLNRMKRK